MTTINPQIDEAVLEMKARAAEFDNKVEVGWRPMSECDARDIPQFIHRAVNNLYEARTAWLRHLSGQDDADYLAIMRKCLCDAPNLCALTLSVLPKGGS